jgi:hypothetical protein
MLLAAPVVFIAGYAIFLTNFNAIVTPTGLGNRMAIAGTVGLALAIVGSVVVLSRAVGDQMWQRRTFSALIAATCAVGVLAMATLGQFWVTAAKRQQAVLGDILRDVRPLPMGSTLILDGVCPYVGPVPIFETSWDLQGALHLLGHRTKLSANVATPGLRVEADGLIVSIYGAPTTYPYGPLFVYDHESGMTHPPQAAAYSPRYARPTRHRRRCARLLRRI